MYCKLFEYDSKGKQLHFIMHGVCGSKKVQLDTWLLAEQKKVSDGSGGKTYVSGFHVFKPCTNQKILQYCRRFNLERPSGRQLVLVPVSIAGDIREKPTNSDILLVSEMWIDSDSFVFPVENIFILNDDY